MNLLSILITVVTVGITRAIAVLDAGAAREQRKAEASLRKAGALVTQATAHRAQANAARTVSAKLTALTADQ